MIIYLAFALLSTLFNLSLQYLWVSIYNGRYELESAILIGTLGGFVLKYLLDKFFVFKRSEKKVDIKELFFYGFTSFFTTIIFWGVEWFFHFAYESEYSMYLGGFIGLSIGYILKFYLDKNFVFNVSSRNLNSWGNYPKIDNSSIEPVSKSSLKDIIGDHVKYIPYGNGRSYGDSALSKNIIKSSELNKFIGFDPDSGLLEAQAGVLLSDIIKIFVSKGWFLKISPGTSYITLGGAIAADVHGKNHHIDGCFSSCLESFTLMLANGDVKECSRLENKELFYATCGGMGLTGVIINVKIYLKKINSKWITQNLVSCKNLKELFAAFKTHQNVTYSVAWIDCLAKGSSIGRSILMLGEFGEDGDLNYKPKRRLNVPFFLPSFCLNYITIKAFNTLYYFIKRGKKSSFKVSIDDFFYPLDAIRNWNRLYGKNGFLQYQFILPEKVSYEGLLKILTIIAKKKKGSFLAVLKLYGEENENYLSFPIKGYSLALDFKIERGIFELLDHLDQIVVELGGRIYLAKDARMSRETFERTYHKLSNFRRIRQEIDVSNKFESLQSKRLGL